VDRLNDKRTSFQYLEKQEGFQRYKLDWNVLTGVHVEQSANESGWHDGLRELLQILAEKGRGGRWTSGRLQIGVTPTFEGRPQPFRQPGIAARQAEHRRALESVRLDVAA